MLMRLAGGRMMDPAHGIDGQVRDVYVRDGRIIDPPADAAAAQSWPGRSTCIRTSAAAR